MEEQKEIKERYELTLDIHDKIPGLGESTIIKKIEKFLKSEGYDVSLDYENSSLTILTDRKSFSPISSGN